MNHARKWDDVEPELRGRLRKHPLRGHIRAVIRLARLLARRSGTDPGKAAAAGLLHDWLKPLSIPRLRALARRYGVRFSRADRAAPAVWHGPVAAAWAQRECGVRDRDLLRAVQWHTTGRPGASMLERVVFVADFCAAGRAFPEAAAGFRLARRSLALATRYVLACKLAYLNRTGTASHPAATAMLRELAGSCGGA